MVTRRAGATLPEFLVSALVVSLLLGFSLAGLGDLLGPDAPGSAHLCRANRRALRGALAALQMREGRAEPPALPAAYPALRRAGLITAIPVEPGTEGWGYTYVTAPEGAVVCRRHDLREGYETRRDFGRLARLLARLALFGLAMAVWVIRRLRALAAEADPAARGPDPAIEVPGLPVDADVAGEVAEFLRGMAAEE